MAADVIVLVKDFEVGTRIADAVTALGREISFPEDVAAGEESLSEETNLLIIDLEEKTYDPLEMVKRIRVRFPHLSVVGFRSRVRKEAYKQAREAGCSWVFTRPSLVRNLPTLLNADPH